MGEPAIVYAKQLNPLKYGHPLWFPEPAPEGEIDIGDVGFLDDGGFHRVFNIFEDAAHNARVVPEGFAPCELPGRHLIVEKDQYLDPGIYKSHGVETHTITPQITGIVPGTPAQVGASYEFLCSQDEGAFLLLSDKASLKKVYRSHTLEKYIKKNHRSWHAFITQALDYRCELGDVVCVNGCVKTRAWTTAALSRTNKSRGGKIQGQCTPAASVGFYIQTTKESQMELIHRSGPKQESRVSREDQCIFITFYQVQYKLLSLIKTIKAGAGAEDFRQGRYESGASGDLMVNALDSGLEPQDEDEPVLQVVPTPLKTSFLLDSLLDRMLECTDAEMVLVSHDELYNLPVFNGERSPSDDDVHNYLTTFIPDINIDDGVGTLRPPSEHRSSDSTMRSYSEVSSLGLKRPARRPSVATPVRVASEDHYYDEREQPPSVSGSSSTTTASSWRMQLNNLLQKSYGSGSLRWDMYQGTARHDSPWTAVAFINGVEHGKGIGRSQGDAKEEASRVAYDRLYRELHTGR